MKLKVMLAAAASLMAMATCQAESLLLTAPAAQDPATVVAAVDHPAPAQIRELSIPAAKTLLKSTEGKAWRVFAVNGPACEKKSAKKCKAIKRECRNAKKIAKQYRKHATCSALYQHSTVLLTTAQPAKK